MKREDIARRISDSLVISNSRWRHLKRIHTLFLIVSLLTGGGATSLTALTTLFPEWVLGIFVLKNDNDKKAVDYDDNDNKGYSLICGIAAILALISSICGGINQGQGNEKRVTDTFSCIGRLKALDTLLMDDKQSLSKILEDYAKITSDYPDLTA